jgi:hypothetical protein
MAQVPKRIPATVRQQTSHWLLTSLSDRTTLWLMRPSAFLVCVIIYTFATRRITMFDLHRTIYSLAQVWQVTFDLDTCQVSLNIIGHLLAACCL